MAFNTDGTGEPDILEIPDVVADLQNRIVALSSLEHYLANIDINKFSQFYNEFGPEQRGIVIRGISWYLNQLVTRGRMEYVARVRDDQFLFLTPFQEIPAAVHDNIEDEVFPKSRANLAPVGDQDPCRVKVHMGVLSFKPARITNVDALVNRVLALTQDAYQETPQIKREHWTG